MGMEMSKNKRKRRRRNWVLTRITPFEPQRAISFVSNGEEGYWRYTGEYEGKGGLGGSDIGRGLVSGGGEFLITCGVIRRTS